MLHLRLLMSAILIPSTIGLFAWDHHLGDSAPVLFVLVMLISARCIWEFVTLTRNAGFQPNLALCLLSSWLLLLLTWAHHYPWGRWELGWADLRFVNLFGVFGITAVMLLMNAVFRFPLHDSGTDSNSAPSKAGANIGTLGIEFFCVAYLGVLLAMTCQLRWVGKGEGYFALGAMVVATKMGDVGAYTFGRLIGGAKMTPKLSPGKTWSGGVGHVATAGLAAVAWLCWLGPMISTGWLAWNVVNATLFGVVVGFTGLVGDLAESLIKRDVGAKDAPILLPGFGGLLDLMDSLLLAGPVALGMWTLLSFMR